MAHPTVLEIDGMSCGHCVASVEKALAKVAGVRVDRVIVGQATIVGDDDRAIAAARAAVEKAGFPCRPSEPKAT